MATAAAKIENSTKSQTLNEKGLASFKVPAGKRVELRDTIVPQLRLRASPTSKSWSVVYRVAGEGAGGLKGDMRRMTLGDYPRVAIAKARELARDALEHAERGLDPAKQRKVQVITRNERAFETIAERFIEEYAKVEQVEWKSTKYYLDFYVVPQWRGRPVEEIRRGDVSALLAHVRKEAIKQAQAKCEKGGRTRADERHQLSGTSAAREVRKRVRKLFNWALMHDLVEFNPAAGTRPELAYGKRERNLSLEELRRVWEGAGSLGYPFGDITRLLILTGQRRSEVAEVPDEWLNGKERLILIPKEAYKTKREHAYPLSKPALAIIEALPRTGDSRFLFPANKRRTDPAEKDTPVSGFSKIKLKLDKIIADEGQKKGLGPMEPWTLHDIRRSVATQLAALGTPGDHIERVLGHVLEGVKGVYDRYPYLKEKRAALEKWGMLWS
jgi:integrase